mmetsp:Transcript_8036/g.12957  ORF Transcript_8036/g.12957 Transcript_8036/m.12957 type:complete len:270 (+) Transcript_8036:550-1359(+)
MSAIRQKNFATNTQGLVGMDKFVEAHLRAEWVVSKVVRWAATMTKHLLVVLTTSFLPKKEKTRRRRKRKIRKKRKRLILIFLMTRTLDLEMRTKKVVTLLGGMMTLESLKMQVMILENLTTMMTLAGLTMTARRNLPRRRNQKRKKRKERKRTMKTTYLGEGMRPQPKEANHLKPLTHLEPWGEGQPRPRVGHQTTGLGLNLHLLKRHLLYLFESFRTPVEVMISVSETLRNQLLRSKNQLQATQIYLGTSRGWLATIIVETAVGIRGV